MEILYLDNHDPLDPQAGGGELRVIKEAEELVRRGHDVTIFASHTVPGELRNRQKDGVKIRTIKCVPDFLARFKTVHLYLAQALFPIVSIFYILKSLLYRDLDVVVDNLAPHPTLAPVIALLFSTPTVAIAHEYHDRTALQKYPLPIGVIQLIVQNFLRAGLYERVIVPREDTKNKLVSYGVSAPIDVIPNGIDIEKYNNHSETSEVAEYDICLVSRLVDRKGIDDLLRAIKSMDSNESSISVAVAGDGPKRQELERLSTKLGIEENIDFRGYISENEKITLLKNSRIFAFPSKQEGFGIVGLEAMAVGLPIVANDLEVLRELIPEEGGIFVDASNSEEFARAMTELLKEPADKYYNRQSANTLEANKYSWESVGEKSENVYEAVCSVRK